MLAERWIGMQDEQQFKVVRDRQHAPANERPYETPEHLARLVTVRCVGRNGFVGHGGKVIRPGETGRVRWIDAQGLIHIGKAQLCE